MQKVDYKKNLIIMAHFDTIVVGGGIAGVSAAVAASRQGAKVLLVEKSVVWGGLATAGLIVYYLPLCDGKGRKVTGGIAEELLHLSIKYGESTLPEGWRMGSDTGPEKRYRTKFNPASFIAAMDELIKSEGITPLLDTRVCDVIALDNRIIGIVTHNNDGICVYTGESFVDASGQALLFEQAGCDTVVSNNYMTYWAQSMDLQSLKKGLDDNDVNKALKLETMFFDAFGSDNNDSLGEPIYSAETGAKVTEFIMEGRRGILNSKDKITNNQKAWVSLPTMAQYRKIRRIVSPYVLNDKDVNKRFENSIGVISDWRRPGPIYEVPYTTLYGKIDNLFAAGRCIGAKGDAWEVTRCIPQAALTGHSAGAAAALLAKNSIKACDMDVEFLQNELEKQGIIIHY